MELTHELAVDWQRPSFHFDLSGNYNEEIEKEVDQEPVVSKNANYVSTKKKKYDFSS